MEIRNYAEGDEYKILELFNLVFNRKLPVENWNWRYKENPFGKLSNSLLWEGSTLIGHVAVVPLPIKVGLQSSIGAFAVKVMIHPDFTGRKLFNYLASNFFSELEINRKFSSLFAFPNSNSHYIFINNLKWKDIGILSTLRLKTEVLKKKGVSASFLELMTFDSATLELFDKQVSAVRVDKSSEYLNWRYIQKPNAKYRMFKSISDIGVNFIICSVYYQKDGQVILNLVETIVEDSDAFNDLLVYAVSQYEVKIDEITLWKTPYNSRYGCFERLNFKPDAPITYFIGKSIEIAPEDLYPISSWDISMGDSDVF